MVKWIALLLVLSPTVVSAEFIKNRTDWNKLGPSQKAFYVMGMLDYQISVVADEWLSQYNSDIESCIVDLGLTAGGISEIIDRGYEDLEKWEQPPIPVYFMGIRKVCLNHMNRARAARGDELLEP